MEKGKYQMASVQLMESLIDEGCELESRDSIDSKLAWVISYAERIKIAEYLGYFEHTGDWDPYLIIELKSGESIETCSGYFYLEVKGFLSIDRVHKVPKDPVIIQVTDTKEDSDNWEDEEFTREFNLEEIKSINIYT